MVSLQNVLELQGTDRNCRLCAEPYPKANPVYTLSNKPHILDKIDSTLGIKVDVEKDREEEDISSAVKLLTIKFFCIL